MKTGSETCSNARARGQFFAFGLHDCYAERWLTRYPELLEKLRKIGDLVSADALCDRIFLEENSGSHTRNEPSHWNRISSLRQLVDMPPLLGSSSSFYTDHRRPNMSQSGPRHLPAIERVGGQSR